MSRRVSDEARVLAAGGSFAAVATVALFWSVWNLVVTIVERGLEAALLTPWGILDLPLLVLWYVGLVYALALLRLEPSGRRVLSVVAVLLAIASVAGLAAEIRGPAIVGRREWVLSAVLLVYFCIVALYLRSGRARRVFESRRHKGDVRAK